MLRKFMVFKTVTLAVLVLALFPGIGCAGGPFRSWFAPPGTIQQQRARATLHDPYPDQDLGPEVVGGRPREFANQMPEPVRQRYFYDSFWKR